MQIHGGCTTAVYGCCSCCCCHRACIILWCMQFLCALYNTYGKPRDLLILPFSSQCLLVNGICRGPSREEVAFPLQSGDSIVALFHVMELKGERETLSLRSYQQLIAITIMRITEPVSSKLTVYIWPAHLFLEIGPQMGPQDRVLCWPQQLKSAFLLILFGGPIPVFIRQRPSPNSCISKTAQDLDCSSAIFQMYQLLNHSESIPLNLC